MCCASGTRRPGTTKTRAVIDERLAMPREPRFFTAEELRDA